MSASITLPQRRLLCASIAATLLVISTQGAARNLDGSAANPADRSAEVATATTEPWVLVNGAQLSLLPGSATGGISADLDSIVNVSNATVQGTGLQYGVQIRSNSTATITDSSLIGTGARGVGLIIAGQIQEVRPPSVATVTNSTLTGPRAGALITSGGVLTAHHSSFTGTALGVATADPLRGVGILVQEGTLRADQQSVIQGSESALLIYNDDNTDNGYGRHVVIDDSTLLSNGPIIRAATLLSTNLTNADIILQNNTRTASDTGVLLSVEGAQTIDLAIDASTIDGDVNVINGGIANVSLRNQAVLNGAMHSATAVAVDAASTWNITGNSDVASLALAGGTLAFIPPADGTYKALTVHGDVTGSGGSLVLNTDLARVGPVAVQGTDRLLVEGNVNVTAPIAIAFQGNPQAGVATDANGNGVDDAAEGISLVQVAGSSTAQAFALKGGYVAAGPWQYTLHAFGPGQAQAADATETAFADGRAPTWDYRLASREVCESNCGPVVPDPDPDPGVDPVPVPDPDPGIDPGTDPEPPVSRTAVVPQLPSYLSAPAALMAYGDMLNDGLHQRLGDIRQGKAYGATGGELFARYVGGQYRYSSNESFRNFGFDFDQQVNALQVGGNVLGLFGDNSTLRAGWALDRGTTRITPHAVDGGSRSKYTATGVSAWLTWQLDSGFYVDAVVGGRSYRGDVGTDLRGSDVAKIRATGRTLSVEAGYPIAVGKNWTLEPQLQVQHQTLTFEDFRDADDLDVRLGTSRTTTTRLGAMLTRTANVRFMPYARLDLSHSGNGRSSAEVSSDEFNIASRFNAGRVGNAWRGSVGAVSQVTPHVQLFGEGNYQHFVGTFGMQGWSANAGVRVTF